MGDLVVISVEDIKGIDVITLPLRLGANGLAFLDGSKAQRKVRSGRRSMRIYEQTQTNAPVGNPSRNVRIAVAIGGKRT